jgi:hypothetical protein
MDLMYKMNKIHSLLSDLELEEELAVGIKQRDVDQKFIYMDQ